MDDDAGLRRLIQRALGKRGFDVETAESAEEGLACIARTKYDLVAIDNHMPVKSGRQMLDDIVKMGGHPAVVFVTGDSDTAVAVEAIHAGATDFVVKTVGDSFFDLLDSRFRQAFARDRLEREKREAEASLREANERLEMLVREVHHRVSNSLQMVQSFVAMQANQTDSEDAKDALEATQNRIKAIGKVHQNLYTRGDLTTIDLDEYLGTLVEEFRSNMSETDDCVELTYTSDHVEVSPDDAVNVGVVVNELVSNAAKYAFAEGEKGRVDVVLVALDDGYSVTVSDNGGGIAEGAGPSGTGLGMRIIKAITRSLGTNLEQLECETGTSHRFVVRTDPS
ncbi:histidine kinase dimerization/phosphoacceptor domain -containing protein [Erythrobacter sp. SD-21]|uniref:histidine kinase dimerization/phosphoacceptor domain -containing protein n=1 Tax=Erythrobacter sp. SD-21 TaxID=161528 RepID=UPI000153F840|nr:histidine kinase dimerization/phosphoacceptor domain -containing protein [Erythrobacter sp. SD-21]EDL50265.1 two-component sensor protein [Erythrobacter sp. SD-21]